MARKSIEETREYNRQWHAKNSARRTRMQGERRKERQRWFREEIKPLYKCAHCPETDPIVIDFHHNYPESKTFEVSVLATTYYSKKRILEEIEKCTPLCANCHRREEYRLKQAIIAQR